MNAYRIVFRTAFHGSFTISVAEGALTFAPGGARLTIPGDRLQRFEEAMRRYEAVPPPWNSEPAPDAGFDGAVLEGELRTGGRTETWSAWSPRRDECPVRYRFALKLVQLAWNLDDGSLTERLLKLRTYFGDELPRVPVVERPAGEGRRVRVLRYYTADQHAALVQWVAQAPEGPLVVELVDWSNPIDMRGWLEPLLRRAQTSFAAQEPLRSRLATEYGATLTA